MRVNLKNSIKIDIFCLYIIDFSKRCCKDHKKRRKFRSFCTLFYRFSLGFKTFYAFMQ